jgi:hypothetical protein
MAAIGAEMSFLLLPPSPFCASEKESRNREKSRACARERASAAFSRMFASPAFSRVDQQPLGRAIRVQCGCLDEDIPGMASGSVSTCAGPTMAPRR